MKFIRLATHSFLFLVVFAPASLAQAQRTFVSGGGSDSNPCSRIAPCRSFAQAISQTNAGGEVIALDSAGYGSFTIAKSISVIAAPGVYAGISVFSGVGIDIFAGASDTVILRGLTVSSQSNSSTGIVFSAGGSLHVEGCVVNGFTGGNALAFFGPGLLELKDSVIRGNNTGAVVESTSGVALAAIDNVRFEANGIALYALDGSQVTVRSSTASGNGNSGFVAHTTSAASVRLNLEDCVASDFTYGIGATSGSSGTGPVDVTVERCLVSNNEFGIFAAAGSTGIVMARVSDSTVTDNLIGLRNNGAPAAILSRGNNTVEGNGTDTQGTIGSYTAK